jgi:hypothetical protein
MEPVEPGDAALQEGKESAHGLARLRRAQQVELVEQENELVAAERLEDPGQENRQESIRVAFEFTPRREKDRRRTAHFQLLDDGPAEVVQDRAQGQCRLVLQVEQDELEPVEANLMTHLEQHGRLADPPLTVEDDDPGTSSEVVRQEGEQVFAAEELGRIGDRRTDGVGVLREARCKVHRIPSLRGERLSRKDLAPHSPLGPERHCRPVHDNRRARGQQENRGGQRLGQKHSRTSLEMTGVYEGERRPWPLDPDRRRHARTVHDARRRLPRRHRRSS